ncbi:MAG TPA: SufE family protein [Thermoanaerobaculia bacterium]|nr:SufE family protein [Thermoanaerobaculia bacterium]
MDAGALPPKLRHHLETLELMPDRADRIQLLIDLADRFRGVPPRVATRPFPEEHRVPQCESEAFVWAERRDDGTLDFHFAVDNPQGISARALAAMLQDGLGGQPPEAVLGVPGDLIYEVFGRELSMGKNLGLLGMIQMCHAFARRELAARRAG